MNNNKNNKHKRERRGEGKEMNESQIEDGDEKGRREESRTR